jgi:Leucine-rich repeat (LRR) protein
MASKDLYTKLCEAYSDKNLNTITSKIIELYKSKQHQKLKGLLNAIGKYIDFQDENINKSFSKLIFMYHPDKGHQYRNEIDQIQKSGKTELLNEYAHIFLAEDIESLSVDADDDLDIDYTPEYGFEEDSSEFDYYEGAYPQSDDLRDDLSDFDFDDTFFGAMKRKYYGRLMVDMPSYYLEDLDEIEMTNYDIADLSGIEYCRQLVFLDLSDNCITDISDLKGLMLLEEIYLSNNEIGYIDIVSNLVKLRVLDISNNAIDDLTPLFELPDLEYVNLVGNRIPLEQIAFLKKKGVLVVN